MIKTVCRLSSNVPDDFYFIQIAREETLLSGLLNASKHHPGTAAVRSECTMMKVICMGSGQKDDCKCAITPLDCCWRYHSRRIGERGKERTRLIREQDWYIEIAELKTQFWQLHNLIDNPIQICVTCVNAQIGIYQMRCWVFPGV